MEDWQSDRMRWTRNPVYPSSGYRGFESLIFRKEISDEIKTPFTLKLAWLKISNLSMKGVFFV